jgi:membrane protein CcdC involved in cytochrome C biogenesis
MTLALSIGHLRPILAAVASLAGAAAMVAWRLRETRTPVTLRKIIAPPLGMSTGLAMFLYPAARVPWSWAAAVFLLGAVVLSIPLVRTTRLERRGDVIVMQRSRAFLAILLGLLVVRFALRAWVEQHVSTLQTGGLFFLLAFGMILRWRGTMWLEFRRLTRPGAAGLPPFPESDIVAD